ncbi:hypothetical protein CTAYLR_004842 [Chrysophaeum taylorii]|uniref:Sulfotransferase n=1 Tax=Chrysophaeum taylorii TaxID=2483200 RepID=A0AAD7UE04_9STRA|nr:hypothetical protein CTAYLR_004842 [Chrysophaeum taylorii]
MTTLARTIALCGSVVVASERRAELWCERCYNASGAWDDPPLGFRYSRFHRDPRLGPVCGSVFGFMGSFSVRTVEDAIAGRTRASERPDYRDSIAEFFESTTREPVFYAQVPKTGSTTMKSFGQTKKSKVKRNLDAHVRAFTVVRDPLRRFLSGYGTLRHRCFFDKECVNSAPFFKNHSNEEDRFRSYVDYLIAHGDGVLDLHNPPGLKTMWWHTLSVMWFLEQFSWLFDFILHLENLDAEVHELAKYLPLKVVNQGHKLPKNNVKEGPIDPARFLVTAPDACQKIVDHYLYQDYVCLQYPKPTIPL